MSEGMPPAVQRPPPPPRPPPASPATASVGASDPASPPAASVAESDYSDVLDAQLRRLLTRQAERLPVALRELRRDGRKSGHWAWWAFPTAKAGFSEPEPTTRVTRETARVVLARAPRAWREVLEEVARLTAERGGDVLPSIDHGRVDFFCQFWPNVDGAPAWLTDVCATLAAAYGTEGVPRAGARLPALPGSFLRNRSI